MKVHEAWTIPDDRDKCPCCLAGEVEMSEPCPVCEGFGFIVDEAPTEHGKTGQRCPDCGASMYIRKRHPRLYCDPCGKQFPDTES